MSELNKRRFEVQSILRDSILKGLAATLPKEEAEKWEVVEHGNAALVNADGAVLMKLVRIKNHGWQWDTEHVGESDESSGEYGDESSESEESGESDEEAIDEHQIQLQSWQLHFIRKRTDETTDDDYVVSDVASNIASWFNGRGCEVLRKKNISNFRIDTAQIFEYNDNSDLYQKRVVFTMRLCVPKIIAISTQT